MSTRLAHRLTALAALGAGFLLATAAHATVIDFSATMSFDTSSVPNVTLSSSGLTNLALTADSGFTTVTNYLEASVANGAWSATNADITATFNFTAPAGSTTASGSVTNSGNANGNGGTGELNISWVNPTFFNFTYNAINYELEILLSGLSTTPCTNTTGQHAVQNCLAANGPYGMDAQFALITIGPGNISVPEPGTLALLGSGLIGLMFLRGRAKKA